MSLESTFFVFDSLDSQDGLKLAAKRYIYGDSADNSEGLTLLFAHCIGGRTFPC